MKDEPAATNNQAQCAYVFNLCIYAFANLISYLPAAVCKSLCILTALEMTPGQGVL